MASIRISALLSIVAGVLCTQCVHAADSLSVEIRSVLDKKFPEWRFPILGPQIKGCNASSALLVRGDFDGDGLPDYAIGIVYRGDLLVVALLGNGREQVLARNSITTNGASVDQALDVLRKGERISDGPMYAHDAVVTLDCAGPATVTYYSVRAGKWHSDVQVTE